MGSGMGILPMHRGTTLAVFRTNTRPPDLPDDL